MKSHQYMLTGKNQTIANWVALQQRQRERHWENFNTLAFYDRRGLKLAWVYISISAVDLAVHVASRPCALWCYPDILSLVFGYPFLQVGVRRITAPIAASNRAACHTAESLGFVAEGRLRAAELSGDDLVIYGMLRGECRWLQETKNALAA